MGKVTDVTRALQFTGNAGRFNALRDSNRSGKYIGADFEKLFDGNLWGSLTLQDRWKNSHKVVYAAVAQENGTGPHVEDNLLDKFENWLTTSKTKLSWAKVTVYIDQSPCTQCSAMLGQRTWDLAKLLCYDGLVEFSFVFRKCYAKGEGDNSRKNLFSSWEDAADHYCDEVNGGRTDGKLTRLLLVRHISATKGKGGERYSFGEAFRSIYTSA